MGDDSMLNLDITSQSNSMVKFFWDVTIGFLKFCLIMFLIVFLLMFIYYTLFLIADKINQCGIENKSFATKIISNWIAYINPILIIIPNIIYRIFKKLQSLI